MSDREGENKMKIVLTGDYPYGDSEIWGGVQSVLHNLKMGLDKDGKEVRILSGSTKPDSKFESNEDVVYVKIPRLRFGTAFLSTYPIRIKKLMRRLDLDILNCHSLDFAYYGLKYYEDLIFTLHGVTWEEEKYLPFFKRIGWHIFYSDRLKKLLKDLNYLVSINPYITELVSGYTNAEIFEIPNPVPGEYFELQDRSNGDRLFYIGVISRRKNILKLIEALKIVKKERKGIKLFVAGKVTDQDYFREIKKYVSENDLEDVVEFLGMISREEKFRQLEEMDVLVLPSLQETAPMVISEAFASGKPVIASDVGGNRYMLGDGKRGLLIDVDDKNDIAEKMIYMLEDETLAGKMGKRAKDYAVKNHHIDAVKERYLEAYESVLNG